MEINDFIKLFADQFDETPIESFTAKAVYKELEEWNSLTALSVIAMVDDDCGKTITGADLRACSTIEELYAFVFSK
jgi:acyl carrier protein